MRNEPVVAPRRGGAEKIDWTKVDEAALLRGVLGRDERAWRELLQRYNATINKRMKFLLGRCWRRFRASDTPEDIRAEVYAALTKNDMGRLRAFDPKRGSLKAWLSMITQQVTLTELERLMRRPMPVPLDAFIDEEEHDHQRGAHWISDDWDARVELEDSDR